MELLRESTRYGARYCCRRISCREMQVRLGEAVFPRAIEDSVWGLEFLETGERLVENLGHVKTGNLAVEHRRRKKP